MSNHTSVWVVEISKHTSVWVVEIVSNGIFAAHAPQYYNPCLKDRASSMLRLFVLVESAQHSPAPSFDPGYWFESKVRINSFQGKGGNECFPKMSFTLLLACLPRKKKRWEREKIYISYIETPLTARNPSESPRDSAGFQTPDLQSWASSSLYGLPHMTLNAWIPLRLQQANNGWRVRTMDEGAYQYLYILIGKMYLLCWYWQVHIFK